MRAESMFFFRKAERHRGRIHGGGQGGDSGAGLDANPEDARSFGSRKESVATKSDFHRLRRLLADKFQRDVQRLGTHPAGIRREAAYPFQEALNALADGIIDVEGNENSHDSRESSVFSRQELRTNRRCRSRKADNRRLKTEDGYINFLLTMSSACCEANQRMRLRSPGKFRSTTSVPLSPAKAWKTSPTGFSAVPPVGPATPVMPMPKVAPQRLRIPSARAAATSRLTAPCFLIRLAGTSANAVFSSFE